MLCRKRFQAETVKRVIFRFFYSVELASSSTAGAGGRIVFVSETTRNFPNGHSQCEEREVVISLSRCFLKRVIASFSAAAYVFCTCQ